MAFTTDLLMEARTTLLGRILEPPLLNFQAPGLDSTSASHNNKGLLGRHYNLPYQPVQVQRPWTHGRVQEV